MPILIYSAYFPRVWPGMPNIQLCTLPKLKHAKQFYRRSGLRIPCPMMKWSFSRFDMSRSSSNTLPLATKLSVPPSRSFVDTCSVSFDFFFNVIDTSLFFFIVAFDSRGVRGDSFSYKLTTKSQMSHNALHHGQHVVNKAGCSVEWIRRVSW